ncbi:PEP-CTERM sorting domain-containing protein [Massilia sp. CCM 8692]|uniref:PEP-CTERM sorting domain-containing protein n=2 Tax=Massilia rubra TaxID=2607910 RepID=A0ABX0LV18_9BURK|nr:PEP-CTERM sorting domain-containing protein [Massilia rubra]
MMLKQTCMFGLICGLVSGAASAHMTATSTISNFSYQLIDLNPDDGVVASLSWQAVAPAGHRMDSTVYVLGDIPALQVYDEAFARGTRLLEPLSVSMTKLHGSGSASVTGALEKELTLHTSVTSATEAPGTESPSRWTAESSTGAIPFILSPNTAVIFSADLSGGGTQGIPGGISDGGLGARTNLGGNWQHLTDRGSWYSDSGPSYMKRLQLTVSNAYAYSTTNFVEVNARSFLYDSAGAVPEPSSWMMLLAGLGIAGFASLRASRMGR